MAQSVLSLVNTDPNKPARVTVKIQGAAAKKISARVLTTDAMNAHNTFEAPETGETGGLQRWQAQGRLVGVRPAVEVRGRRYPELRKESLRTWLTSSSPCCSRPR
jgi:hypothetical protein